MFNFLLTMFAVAQALGPAPVLLGMAGSFAILCKTGVSNVPTSYITGDIGVSPISATAMTGWTDFNSDQSSNQFGGFATSSEVVGKMYAANYNNPTPAGLTTAILDMQAAYIDTRDRPGPSDVELGEGHIGGYTLAPGLYKWSTDINIAADVTLNGTSKDTWIMYTSGSMVMAADTKVVLQGGALSENIVWSMAQKSQLGARAHSEGIMISSEKAEFITGASLNGRVLSLTAVTLQMNTITQPVSSVEFIDRGGSGSGLV
jgi:hypothetical protein